MIGGQVIDLESEDKPREICLVLEMYKNKTGKLLAAAASIGTILAGGNDDEIALAEDFAYNLGIAFQIKDDILDIVGDSKLLGKPVGSDSKNEKSTYVSIVGLEKAKEDVKRYTDKAVSSIERFNEKAKTLTSLANYLISRDY